MPQRARAAGFTMVEILVVIAVIGVLSTFAVVALGGASRKARDVKRQNTLSQIGRFIASGQCYMPDAGAGDYDLAALLTEVKAKNPQYANFLSSAPKDPRTGTDEVSGYRYVISADASGCALYANFEGEQEITLPTLTAPTPGAGTGALRAATPGPNGTNVYYQYSNK